MCHVLFSCFVKVSVLPSQEGKRTKKKKKKAIFLDCVKIIFMSGKDHKLDKVDLLELQWSVGINRSPSQWSEHTRLPPSTVSHDMWQRHFLFKAARTPVLQKSWAAMISINYHFYCCINSQPSFTVFYLSREENMDSPPKSCCVQKSRWEMLVDSILQVLSIFFL